MSSSDRQTKSTIVKSFLFFLFVIFFADSFVIGQSVQKVSPKPKEENPQIVKWKIFLDSLAQEAKTVSPIERRAFVLVDVANAYWEVNQAEAKDMFFKALDIAWDLTEKEPKNRRILNYVISGATKKDSVLSAEITKKLLEKEDDLKKKDDISSDVGLEMMKDDLVKAAQIVEQNAPNGIQNGTAVFFILRLAQKDLQLANRVHATFVQKVSVNEGLSIATILPLAGYSFGYSEFYKLGNSGNLSGMNLPAIKGVSANPTIARNFLNVAFRRLQRSIEIRDNLAGANANELNLQILFALDYLIPEVGRFAPNLLPAWEELFQRGQVGVSVEQTQLIAEKIRQVKQNRANSQKFVDNPNNEEEMAEKSLEDVEKISDACQRDLVYSEATIGFLSSKNFKRALETAEKIKDINQSEDVLEMVFFDMAKDLIEKERLDEAGEFIKKVRTAELKIVLNFTLAEKLFQKNDSITGNQILFEVASLIEKLAKNKDKAGVLFSVAALQSKHNPTEAQNSLNEAIKILNKEEPQDFWRFSIFTKINLDCNEKKEKFFGGSLTLPNATLIDSLKIYAGIKADEASLIAQNLNDKITRLRVMSFIGKIGLDKAKNAKLSTPKKNKIG